VGENGGTEDETVAALLHDAPEDRGGKECLEEIRVRFGDEVAKIVDGCTDTYEDPKPEWRPRKEAYIAHVAEASPSVRLVSAADKLHNARSILADLRAVGDELWERFTGGKEGYSVVLPHPRRSLRRGRLEPGRRGTGRVVREIEALAGIPGRRTETREGTGVGGKRRADEPLRLGILGVARIAVGGIIPPLPAQKRSR
jgi:hypothetical protein